MGALSVSKVREGGVGRVKSKGGEGVKAREGCWMVTATVMTPTSDGEREVQGCKGRGGRHERTREVRRVHRKLESWEKAKEGVVLGARAARRAQAPGVRVPSHSVVR